MSPQALCSEIIISQSELAAWRCPRKWFVNWYLGYAPAHEAVTGNAPLGSRVHTALEGWYGYGLDPLAVLHLVYRIEAAAHADEPEVLEELAKELDLADAMVAGYLEHIMTSGEDARMTVLAAEQEVRVAMPGCRGAVTLRCKLDAVALRDDGLLAWLDHKTGAGFTRSRMLPMDPQMRFYSLVHHLLVAGHPEMPAVAGGAVNMLRRVKRTEKSKPPYYLREWFRYPPEVVDSTFYRVQQLCNEILEARRRLDEARQRGWSLAEVDYVQRSTLRPVPIIDRCDWECPLAAGLCVAMDDGSDWAGILERSGAWVQVDPYAYYTSDMLSNVRRELASTGRVEAEHEGDDHRP